MPVEPRSDAEIEGDSKLDRVSNREAKLSALITAEGARACDEEPPGRLTNREDALLDREFGRDVLKDRFGDRHHLFAARGREPILCGEVAYEGILGDGAHLKQDAREIAARDHLALDRLLDRPDGDDLIANEQ